MLPDQRAISGPFDIVGDVHGCAEELVMLLERLDYRVERDASGGVGAVVPPAGRTLVFVGDFVDRGPDAITVLQIAMSMLEQGAGLAVIGNHDDKFWRWLQGRKVSVNHGLGTTIGQFESYPEREALREKLLAFFARLPSHLWLDGGSMLVAHAGIKGKMIGSTGDQVRRFCLYGDTSGERDASGLPIRYHWAAEYNGRTTIVYGHTPVAEAHWVNNTLCLDTGCCFGGRLSCLRWPELEIVSVGAKDVHTTRLRPFGHPPLRPELAR